MREIHIHSLKLTELVQDISHNKKNERFKLSTNTTYHNGNRRCNIVVVVVVVMMEVMKDGDGG